MTNKYGMQPVPVWESDKRSSEKLAIQARRNKCSRDNILQYAKDLTKTGDDSEEVNGTGDNDNPNSNKNASSSYSVSCRNVNVLLIGLSYSKFVINQFINDPTISNITQCQDKNGRYIDQCVARDTFRCFVLESTYPNTKVYTVNKCTDLVQTVDNETDPTNINSDVGTSLFLKLVKKAI